MSSMRQLGSGLLYALISVVLVVGGLSLALVEGGVNAPTAGNPSSTAPAPSIAPTTVLSPTPLPTEAASPTVQVVMPTATTIVIVPSATIYYAPPTATFRPFPTATRAVYATAVRCGPYYGWVKNYIVQPGDTLFHIATLYRTTVSALQVANCMTTVTIFPGERLWVPNVPVITPVTPGVTFIPTFETPTPYPTEPPTQTPADTAVPTDTSAPNP